MHPLPFTALLLSHIPLPCPHSSSLSSSLISRLSLSAASPVLTFSFPMTISRFFRRAPTRECRLRPRVAWERSTVPTAARRSSRLITKTAHNSRFDLHTSHEQSSSDQIHAPDPAAAEGDTLFAVPNNTVPNEASNEIKQSTCNRNSEPSVKLDVGHPSELTIEKRFEQDNPIQLKSEKSRDENSLVAPEQATVLVSEHVPRDTAIAFAEQDRPATVVNATKLSHYRSNEEDEALLRLNRKQERTGLTQKYVFSWFQSEGSSRSEPAVRQHIAKLKKEHIKGKDSGVRKNVKRGLPSGAGAESSGKKETKESSTTAVQPDNTQCNLAVGTCCSAEPAEFNRYEAKRPHSSAASCWSEKDVDALLRLTGRRPRVNGTTRDVLKWLNDEGISKSETEVRLQIEQKRRKVFEEGGEDAWKRVLLRAGRRDKVIRNNTPGFKLEFASRETDDELLGRR